MDYITIKTLEELEGIEDPQNEQVVYIEDINGYRIYSNNKWYPVEGNVTNSGLNLDIYSLNKQIVAQFPVFDEETWLGAKAVIEDWYNKIDSDYFMLYGREINYFTIFHKKDENTEFSTMYEAIRECYNNVGEVHAVNPSEDGSAIEIWAEVQGKIIVMFLFDYKNGIVTYES